jgi:hypothetical protein
MQLQQHFQFSSLSLSVCVCVCVHFEIETLLRHFETTKRTLRNQSPVWQSVHATIAYIGPICLNMGYSPTK